MALTFRLAQEGDLDAVMRLAGDCIAAMRAAGIDQWDEVYPDRARFAEDTTARSLTLAVGEDGALLGCYVLNETQDPPYQLVTWSLEHPRISVVHRLMVSPKVQGRGVARAMMKHAEESARAAGYRVMRLDAFTENPRAVRLYEQLGYRCVGRAPFRKGHFFCFEKALEA